MQQDENDDSYEEIPWPDFDTYGASANDGGISLDTHNMCELDLVRWLVQANGKMTGKCHGEAGGTWTYHLLQLIVIAASLLVRARSQLQQVAGNREPGHGRGTHCRLHTAVYTGP